MISKYVVYENVVNVICKDGKERYLILCPDDGIISHCPLGCPFCEYPKKCHLSYIGHDEHLCDTFEEVRAIIEPFYDEMFGR